jgi:hypothetical protein
MVTLLLDLGADMERVAGTMPALYAAAELGSVKTMKILLDRGSVGGDVNCIHDGRSLILLSIQY